MKNFGVKVLPLPGTRHSKLLVFILYSRLPCCLFWNQLGCVPVEGSRLGTALYWTRFPAPCFLAVAFELERLKLQTKTSCRRLSHAGGFIQFSVWTGEFFSCLIRKGNILLKWAAERVPTDANISTTTGGIKKKERKNGWRAYCFSFSLSGGSFQSFLTVQAQLSLKLVSALGSNCSVHLQLDKVAW